MVDGSVYYDILGTRVQTVLAAAYNAADNGRVIDMEATGSSLQSKAASPNYRAQKKSVIATYRTLAVVSEIIELIEDRLSKMTAAAGPTPARIAVSYRLPGVVVGNRRFYYMLRHEALSTFLDVKDITFGTFEDTRSLDMIDFTVFVSIRA